MRKLFRSFVSLILVVILLITCIVALTLGYAGLLLHTYNVFTQREPVAKVTISEQREDDLGKYAIVKIQQIKPESTALTRGVFGDSNTNSKLSTPEEFKVYGDFVYIGGPVLKFQDSLIWMNFQNAYKVGKLYGRYEFDNNLENNRTLETSSNFDLNGGFAEWQEVYRLYQEEGFLGDIFRSIFDTTFMSVAGQYVGNRDISYTVYITNTGFLWKLD